MNIYVDFRGAPWMVGSPRPAGDANTPSAASSTQLGWGALLVIAAIGGLVLFGDKWLKVRGG